MPTNKFSIKIITKVAVCLAIIGIAVTGVYLLSKQIKKVNVTIKEKKEMDFLISNREEVNNRIKADFIKVDPSYEQKINASLPPVYDILPFVDAMDSLAKKYSVKETINFNQPVPATDAPGPISLMKIQYNLTLEDLNVDTFNNYLKDFENLPYFASIDSISYLAGSKSGWQENSSINIIGSLYAHE